VISLLCRIATAKFIDVEIKPRVGGRESASIRLLQLVRSGSKATRCLSAWKSQYKRSTAIESGNSRR
jgi:hypothetical protein